MTDRLDPWLLRGFGQPEVSRWRPLQGVKTVWVHVNLSKQSDPRCPIALERLTTVTELKLRATGLRVLSDVDAGRAPETPVVLIELIWIYRDAPPEYAYNLAIELREPGSTRRNPHQEALWWVPMVARRDFIGVVPCHDAAATLVKNCDMFLDELLNEWLKANPR